MIFLNDTSTRLEGCSVALTVGPEYRTLLTPDVRMLVAEPASPCGPQPTAGFAQRLLVRSIQGGAGGAMIRITYVGGTYTHEEDFKVQKASSRPDGRWAATEMRVYDALIAN